jgi:hypothetical protein
LKVRLAFFWENQIDGYEKVLRNVLPSKARIQRSLYPNADPACTCPDFRKNTLGTCTHIIYALKRGRTKFSKKVQNTPATVDEISVYIKYGRRLELRLLLPENLKREVKTKLEPLQGKAIEDPSDLLHRIGQVERLGASRLINKELAECNGL